MHIFKKYRYVLSNIALIVFVAFVLLFTVRGLPGNPTPQQLNTIHWKDNGPFELSPERGRFSLLYSLVENHSFDLQPLLAKFTTPDVGFLNHHYVSIFAPSISFLAIPGYVIGKYFDASQFGTFLWMSLFALLNMLLIRKIALKFGANSLAAILGGLVFLFATPAFAYAVTIYEHHVSTFLILLSFYLLLYFNNTISLIAIWLLYGFSFTVDYPNLFLMFPIAVAAFLKSTVLERFHENVRLRINLSHLFTILAVIYPLIFLLWVNRMSFDNPLKLSGTVPTVDNVAVNGAPIFLTNEQKQHLKQTNQPQNQPPPSALTFFNPRNMVNGFYILLISPDRGILMYTPVIFLGIAGLYVASRKKQKYIWVSVGIIGVNFILYSMWGDPYGGWAFGGRYLIPTYAILAIYVALLLTRFEKKPLFLLFFLVIVSYSVIVNTLGAITSNSNPPQIQAEQLANQTHKYIQYTYMRNADDLSHNISKSFMYQAYANHYISAWQYFRIIVSILLVVFAFLIGLFYRRAKKSLRKEK